MEQNAKSEQNGIFDIAVIGAGPSGLYGAFYAGMRGMNTLILDALPEMGGQLVTLYPEKYIYDVPGFPKILAKDLAKNLIEQALYFNPTVRLSEQVMSLEHVDPERRILEVATAQNSYLARSILIAAGVGAFAPNTLNIPGIDRFEGRGVYYFVKEKSVFQGKRILIVGGGDSAVDWGLNLYETASKVTLIHRREGFRAHESTLQQLRDSPVEVKVFYELLNIHGDDHIEGVTIINNQTKQTEDLEIDAILLSLGFKYDLGPIRDWGFPIEKRSIRVNSDQSTNMPGVYAAGDIAGTSVKLDLIAVGFGQAAVAVNSAKVYIDPSAKLYPGHSSAMSH